VKDPHKKYSLATSDTFDQFRKDYDRTTRTIRRAHLFIFTLAAVLALAVVAATLTGVVLLVRFAFS
jgi:hypothetical protein